MGGSPSASTSTFPTALLPPPDRYGSPTLDDIATFSRLFNAAYEAAVGEAAAGAIEIEVSSAVGVILIGLNLTLSDWLDCDLADG